MTNPNSDNIVSLAKNDSASPVSRYKNCRKITDDEGDQYLETYESIKIPKSEKDKYHTVESSEINRLDLISNKYYGTPLLYWVIAEANDIIDMFEIPAGLVLRIPSTDTLYGYKGVLA